LAYQLSLNIVTPFGLLAAADFLALFRDILDKTNLSREAGLSRQIRDVTVSKFYT
jgi:hypothetical protein